MTHSFNDKKRSASDDESLNELLKDVTDEKEKERLAKAWHALGGMGMTSCPPLPLSKELEMAMKNDSEFRGLDEEMTNDELEMLAAAGTPGDTLRGGAGTDYLAGGTGDDLIEGEGGNDLLFGMDGDDTISGGEGMDRIFGGEGNDVLNGGDGNDQLIGGLGHDVLTGGAGNDLLVGGTGGDVFVFDGSSGNDTITDFNPLEDSLQFEGIGDEQPSYVFENGNTIVTYGDTTITLLGVNLNEGPTNPGGGSSW